MTQVNTIRKELLKSNSISQRSALMDFGIMALPRRIADLKETGFPVKTEIKHNPMTGQRYASYTMDDKVTHISQLKHDCVYRLESLTVSTFFAEQALADSQGYFQPLRNGHATDTDIMVRMASIPQLILQSNLDKGRITIRYIGGMA